MPSLNEVLSSSGSIKLYGELVSDLVPGANFGVQSGTKGDFYFAQIRAFAIGMHCVELPIPATLLVVGKGIQDPNGDGCGKPGETVWRLSSKDETIWVDFRRAGVLDILDDVQTRGIDGGITIENLRITNGQVCGTAHVWYDIEVLGAHAKDDKRIDFCLPLEGCHTIWDIGIGDVNACISAAAPHGINVCLKLCVGKWGLSKCWDICSYIGLPTVVKNPAVQCDCSKQN